MPGGVARVSNFSVQARDLSMRAYELSKKLEDAVHVMSADDCHAWKPVFSPEALAGDCGAFVAKGEKMGG